MFSAEFFDIFGLIGFVILFFVGMSIRRRLIWQGRLVIAISLIGIIVDGWIVLTNFILN